MPLRRAALDTPAAHPHAMRSAPFDGFPYLVTRIGRSALRHLAVLPADWSPDQLLDLARRQALANRLDTGLVGGPADAIYVSADGTTVAGSVVPPGLPVVRRLRLAVDVPASAELEARRTRLDEYAGALRGSGYVVGDGLASGRPASPDDIARLVDGDPARPAPALVRCASCGDLAGYYLAVRGEGNGDLSPRVIAVHCRCANHNRCAGCGGGLAARRLSAYFFDEAARCVWYTAAYAAFSHRCPPRELD